MRKTYVFGDIHGCLDQLQVVLKKIPMNKFNKYIFLGDYIDRGPNSRGVLDCLIEMDKHYNCIFLMGNHEQMMIKSLEHPESKWADTWMINGGFKTIKSYGGKINNISNEHIDFIKSMKISYNLNKDYFFCHAGIDPNIPLKNQSDKDLLWIRNLFVSSTYSFEKKIVFGHTIQYNGPLIKDNMIGIDTGCFHTGILTCLELPSERIIQNV